MVSHPRLWYIRWLDPFTGEDKGLLELYTVQIQPDPFGCLTCAEVIELIERYEESEENV